MKSILLFSLLVFITSSPVVAQGDPTQPQPPYQELRPKSANTAMLMSLGATALPIGVGSLLRDEALAWLVFSGVTFGPSLGYFYADDNRGAFRGILIRTGGYTVATIGALYSLTGLIGGRNNELYNLGVIMVITGGTVVAGSAIYDIFWGTRRSVSRYNEKNNLSVTPWYHPEYNAPGLSVRMRF